MSQKFHVVYRTESTDEDTAVDYGPFGNSDWTDLTSFARYSADSAQTDLVTNYKNYKFTIDWKKDQGISVPTQSPSQDEVWLFLHRFRPIYLQKEATSFHRICNILDRHFKHPQFHEFIRTRKREYSCEDISKGMPIKVGDWVINSDKFLDHYLNAHEYHRDKDKQADIAEISRSFPTEAQWAVLCMLLICKGYAAKDIGKFIGTLEERQDGRRIRLIRP